MHDLAHVFSFAQFDHEHMLVAIVTSMLGCRALTSCADFSRGVTCLYTELLTLLNILGAAGRITHEAGILALDPRQQRELVRDLLGVATRPYDRVTPEHTYRDPAAMALSIIDRLVSRSSYVTNLVREQRGHESLAASLVDFAYRAKGTTRMQTQSYRVLAFRAVSLVHGKLLKLPAMDEARNRIFCSAASPLRFHSEWTDILVNTHVGCPCSKDVLIASLDMCRPPVAAGWPERVEDIASSFVSPVAEALERVMPALATVDPTLWADPHRRRFWRSWLAMAEAGGLAGDSMLSRCEACGAGRAKSRCARCPTRYCALVSLSRVADLSQATRRVRGRRGRRTSRSARPTASLPVPWAVRARLAPASSRMSSAAIPRVSTDWGDYAGR